VPGDFLRHPLNPTLTVRVRAHKVVAPEGPQVDLGHLEDRSGLAQRAEVFQGLVVEILQVLSGLAQLSALVGLVVGPPWIRCSAACVRARKVRGPRGLAGGARDAGLRPVTLTRTLPQPVIRRQRQKDDKSLVKSHVNDPPTNRRIILGENSTCPSLPLVCIKTFKKYNQGGHIRLGLWSNNKTHCVLHA
jgi:hypothetical protein